MTQRILNVVSNVAHYEDSSEPAGLWLSELTHAYDIFAEAGYEQRIVSPTGGLSPLEPRSLKFPNYDKSAKAWKADEAKMALLADTAAPQAVDSADFDAIYFTGVLEQAVFTRRRTDFRFTTTGLVHHSDAGSQCTSVAFTEVLHESGIAGSTPTDPTPTQQARDQQTRTGPAPPPQQRNPNNRRSGSAPATRCR